eukprot:1649363-Rhodomonas_salina.1
MSRADFAGEAAASLTLSAPSASEVWRSPRWRVSCGCGARSKGGSCVPSFQSSARHPRLLKPR